jgi:hypothetical protein
MILGEYVARCTTLLTGDENPANDFAVDTFTVVPGTGIEEPSQLPATVVLEQLHPNPFSRTVTIRFGLPTSGTVRLTVHSATGQVVRTLLAAEKSPGYHTIRWDGRDTEGRLLADGIYFCQLAATGNVRTRKLLKLE